ncbi:hypothetical protein FNV43_RR22300 [Rhamnella rubrinervis]|uniref:Uncharacterized protein n=1 Tax=Rhamnella rubrinervis TaxID=2594499 RepID=A0A8K0DVX8_9ROSA|nr:hypothetical protein FNV43_RR22300 [Rhamnella rubrinervis]
METTQDHTNNNNGDYALIFLEEDSDETLANSIETRLYNGSPLTAKPPLDLENAHILDLIRGVLVPPVSNLQTDHDGLEDEKLDQQPQLIPCVTDLLVAGVKFVTGTTENMMNMHLLHSGKDVEYLIEKGIIDKWMSADDASKLFNRLYIDTFVTNFYYSDLCKSGIKIIGNVPASEEYINNEIENMVRSLIHEMFLFNNIYISSRCCIFKVMQEQESNAQRQEVSSSNIVNDQKAYAPIAFSIGPYHSAKQHLKPSQIIKINYLHDLLTYRTAPQPSSSAAASTHEPLLRDLFREVFVVLNEARECYAGQIDMSEFELLFLMVVDGCFILELFYKIAYGVPARDHQRTSTTSSSTFKLFDPIFGTNFLLQYLYHDLILVENQIPWVVLERLFSRIETTYMKDHQKPLLQLAVEFFEESGIKFKVAAGSSSASECVLDITFHDGVLEIPQLHIHENTETLFRNLVFFEQVSLLAASRFTCYALFLENLIKTSSDMKLLCERGIVDTSLSVEEATQCFRKLNINGAYLKENFYYEITQNVNTSCRRRWPRYLRVLKVEYFKTPWAVLSIAAAVILLILSFLQTLFTVIFR